MYYIIENVTHSYYVISTRKGRSNLNDEYKVITEGEHVKYYERSQRRWNDKRSHSGEISCISKQYNT